MPTGGSKPGGPQSKHLTPRYGRGRGIGGPAKGAGKAESLIEIAGPVGPDSNPAGRAGGYHAMAKAERVETLKDMLWDIAQTAERDNDAIVAINSLLNREDGLPVARHVSLTKDEYDQLSDAELAAERARVDAALAEIASGNPAPDGQGGPDGVVH